MSSFVSRAAMLTGSAKHFILRTHYVQFYAQFLSLMIQVTRSRKAFHLCEHPHLFYSVYIQPVPTLIIKSIFSLRFY